MNTAAFDYWVEKTSLAEVIEIEYNSGYPNGDPFSEKQSKKINFRVDNIQTRILDLQLDFDEPLYISQGPEIC
jgi:hypothetical protein